MIEVDQNCICSYAAKRRQRQTFKIDILIFLHLPKSLLVKFIETLSKVNVDHFKLYDLLDPFLMGRECTGYNTGNKSIACKCIIQGWK